MPTKPDCSKLTKEMLMTRVMGSDLVPPREDSKMVTWTYFGTVERWIDGDTLVVSLDLGLDVWRMHQTIRVAHIDAPEIDTVDGKLALIFAQTAVPVGSRVKIVSHKWEKFGRLLATVTYGDPPSDFATVMLTTGHATPYEG